MISKYLHNKISFQFYYIGVALQTLEKRKAEWGGERGRKGEERSKKINLTLKLGTQFKALFLVLDISETQTVNNQD